MHYLTNLVIPLMILLRLVDGTRADEMVFPGNDGVGGSYDWDDRKRSDQACGRCRASVPTRAVLVTRQ